MTIALAAVAAYLIGSISFAGVLGLLVGKDVKRMGTGNLGAWNAGRTLGVGAGIIVFLGDSSKGLVAVLLARHFLASPWAAAAAGVAAVAGHLWPVFFRFKGGRGLATAVGAAAAVNLWIAVPPVLVTLLTVVLFRNIYVAGLSGIFAIPVTIAVLRPDGAQIFFGLTLAALLLFVHRDDLEDVIHGRKPPVRPVQTS